jgi:serine/tyrosine/threonine adenylyltransferase
LVQLANALAAVVPNVELLQSQINRFPDEYGTRFRSMMTARLGLTEHEGEADDHLMQDLLEVLTVSEIDQVIWFRKLADVLSVEPAEPSDTELLAPLHEAWYQPDEIGGDIASKLASWVRRWLLRVRSEQRTQESIRAQMNALNPKFVLRNYLAQEAIDLATDGDYSLVQEIFDVLRHPYDEQPERERFAARRPEWARHRVGSSMLSCSS